MKKKQYIACILFFISLMVLVIPVIPHHHHADGLICMKNDIATDCCGHPSETDMGHCCCKTGCVTDYFVQQTPHSPQDTAPHPDALDPLILFTESFYKLLLLPQWDVNRQEIPYLESLHGTFITRATGLRAPPMPCA